MKKHFKIIAFLSLIILLNTTLVYSQIKKTKWLDGTWVGIGYQPGFGEQSAWDIELTYDYQNEEFNINYPSFPCSGYWNLKKADKNKAEFIEYITDGKSLCQNGNTIIVTRIDEEYITISYFLPNYNIGLTAFSTLHKKE